MSRPPLTIGGNIALRWSASYRVSSTFYKHLAPLERKLLASLNSSEAEHQATITALESIREPIVLPVPAITEVAYLLARDTGNLISTQIRG